ncbi:hypothetical protein [Deinococcus altitudinis]|uniref:DUF3108 domain-containing protein n=1 Tax=Deinococcus altitudinis TaxID=468914 RepID=UPI003891C8F2
MTSAPLTAEAYSYTLTLGGRFAGTQEWVVRPDKGTLVARVQTDFGGALPAGRTVQESRIQPQTGFSLAYAEAEGSSRKPHFETVFDDSTGMVTLRQHKDEASAPLLEGHHDPLSLLLWVRQIARTAPQATVPEAEDSDTGASGTGASGGGASEVRVPEDPANDPASEARMVTVRMVGGRVHLQPLPASEVQGIAARVYFLRPGGAYVYVEQNAPHRLLRLIQPSDFGPVEALLSLGRPASGRLAPDRATPEQGAARPGQPGHARVRGQVGKPRRRNK